MATLIVEGRSETPGSERDRSSSSRRISAASHVPAPIMPLGGKKSMKDTTIKITQATLKRTASGRADFRVTEAPQYYLHVSEVTANVSFVNHAIKEHWGKDYCLVSSDGLKIEDCAGTKG